MLDSFRRRHLSTSTISNRSTQRSFIAGRYSGYFLFRLSLSLAGNLLGCLFVNSFDHFFVGFDCACRGLGFIWGFFLFGFFRATFWAGAGAGAREGGRNRRRWVRGRLSVFFSMFFVFFLMFFVFFWVFFMPFWLFLFLLFLRNRRRLVLFYWLFNNNCDFLSCFFLKKRFH